MRSRILLGFLIAPALLPLAAFVLGLWDPQLSLPIAGIYSIFTYAIAILAGGPLLYLYLRIRWFLWWQFAAGGFVLGLLPAMMTELFDPGPLPLGFVIVMACFGSASALILWAILRWRNSELQSPNPALQATRDEAARP